MLIILHGTIFARQTLLYGLGKPDSAFLLYCKRHFQPTVSVFLNLVTLMNYSEKISLTKNDSLNALALARKAMILTSNRPLIIT